MEAEVISLLKMTTKFDCANGHMEIEMVLMVTAFVSMAKNVHGP